VAQDNFLKKAGKVFTELTNVAIFLRDNGYPERAILSLMILSEGDETYETGVYAYEIGRCYEDLGKRDEAATFFRIAVMENPAIPEFREAAERYEIALPPDPVSSR
jgi:tetratricopeptide (TPR) repeat protein